MWLIRGNSIRNLDRFDEIYVSKNYDGYSDPEHAPGGNGDFIGYGIFGWHIGCSELLLQGFNTQEEANQRFEQIQQAMRDGKEVI